MTTDKTEDTADGKKREPDHVFAATIAFLGILLIGGAQFYTSCSGEEIASISSVAHWETATAEVVETDYDRAVGNVSAGFYVKFRYRTPDDRTIDGNYSQHGSKIRRVDQGQRIKVHFDRENPQHVYANVHPLKKLALMKSYIKFAEYLKIVGGAIAIVSLLLGAKVIAASMFRPRSFHRAQSKLTSGA